MRIMVLLMAGGLAAAALPGFASAQVAVSTQGDLKPYIVTIRRFDPSQGPQSGQTFELPVDSPDEEHAIASTLANAASFSKKTENGRALPVAFMAVGVVKR